MDNTITTTPSRSTSLDIDAPLFVPLHHRHYFDGYLALTCVSTDTWAGDNEPPRPVPTPPGPPGPPGPSFLSFPGMNQMSMPSSLFSFLSMHHTSPFALTSLGDRRITSSPFLFPSMHHMPMTSFFNNQPFGMNMSNSVGAGGGSSSSTYNTATTTTSTASSSATTINPGNSGDAFKNAVLARLMPPTSSNNSHQPAEALPSTAVTPAQTTTPTTTTTPPPLPPTQEPAVLPSTLVSTTSSFPPHHAIHAHPLLHPPTSIPHLLLPPPLPQLPVPFSCVAPPPMIADDDSSHQDAVSLSAQAPQQLDDATYLLHFTTLLRAELHRNRADMCRYDLHDVKLDLQRVRSSVQSKLPRNEPIQVPTRASDVMDQTFGGITIVATIPVAGVSEGSPRLAYGSVVRLRLSPWKAQSDEFRTTYSMYELASTVNGSDQSILEIEARVLSVNIMRDEVKVKLPLRPITRSCTTCFRRTGREEHNAASCINIACGHQFICRDCSTIAMATQSSYHSPTAGMFYCPFCAVKVVREMPLVDTFCGWLPFPSYLSSHGLDPTKAIVHANARAHSFEQQRREPLLDAAVAKLLQIAVLKAHNEWMQLLTTAKWEIRFEESVSNLVQMMQAVDTSYSKAWTSCAEAMGAIWQSWYGRSTPIPTQVQLYGDKTMAEILKRASSPSSAQLFDANLTSPQARVAWVLSNIQQHLSKQEQTLIRLLFPSVFVIATDSPSRKQLLALHEISKELRSAMIADGGEAAGAGANKSNTKTISSSSSSFLALLQLDDAITTTVGSSVEQARHQLTEMKRRLHQIFLEATLQSDAQSVVIGGSNTSKSTYGAFSTTQTLQAASRIAFPVRTWLNQCLNPTQRAAVQAIVSGVHGRVPYLLMGPAGTGKSSCVLEAVMQLLIRLQKRPSISSTSTSLLTSCEGTAILVVAPSNEACDLLLQGLHTAYEAHLRHIGIVPAINLLPQAQPSFPPPLSGILRLNGPSRRTDSMRPSLLPYCFTDNATGVFSFPSLPVFSACRLVVCNVSTAGVLNSRLGIKPGHFSHIIFDEASQALEPEALLPLSLAGSNTRVILTGDPRQLGPMVRSDLAREHWLGVSLQERLHAGRESLTEYLRKKSAATTLSSSSQQWLSTTPGAEQRTPETLLHLTAVTGTTLIAAAVSAASTSSTIPAFASSSSVTNIGGGNGSGSVRRGIKAPSIEAVVAESLNTLSVSLSDKDDDGNETNIDNNNMNIVTKSNSVHSSAVAAVRNGLMQRIEALCMGEESLYSPSSSSSFSLPSGIDDIKILSGETALEVDNNYWLEAAAEVPRSQDAKSKAQEEHALQQQSRVASLALPSSLPLNQIASAAPQLKQKVQQQGPVVSSSLPSSPVLLSSACSSFSPPSSSVGKKTFAAVAAGRNAATDKTKAFPSIARPLPESSNKFNTDGSGNATKNTPSTTIVKAETSTVESLEDPLDHAFQSTLVINYRSHQALLDLPSRLYYKSTPLISAAPAIETQRCLSFSLLRAGVGDQSASSSSAATNSSTSSATTRTSHTRLPFPLLAVGVQGDDQRASALTDTKSYVNQAEADMIGWLCQSLLSESSTQSVVPYPPPTKTIWRPLPGGAIDKQGSAIGLDVQHPPPPLIPLSSSSATTTTTSGAGGHMMKSSVAVKTMELGQNDIAVICPFRQQVLLVRQKLRELGLHDISVGNAQNLQGAQKSCIIFCSVLSKNNGERILTKMARKRMMGATKNTATAATADSKSRPLLTLPVGLFHDPRGMNVSLTRAQSLLIAVGDPYVWQYDIAWKELLQTAVDHSGYIGVGGCQLPMGVVKRMESVLF